MPGSILCEQFGAVVGAAEFALFLFAGFGLACSIPEPALAGKVLGVLVTIFTASLGITVGRCDALFFGIRTDIAASRRECLKAFNLEGR